jgi:tetratricopeptide (TPR) repeat protein
MRRLFIGVLFIQFCGGCTNGGLLENWKSIYDKAAMEYKNGNYEKAYEYSKRSAEKAKKLFLPDSENTDFAFAITQKADIELKLQKYQEAQKNYNVALVIYKKIRGDNSASVATVLVGIGRTNLALSKQDEAENDFKNAISIYRDKFSENRKSTFTAMLWLADLYYQKKMYKESIKWNEKVLAACDAREDDVPDKCSALINLAENYSAMGKHLREIDYQMKLLAIYGGNSKYLNNELVVKRNMALSYCSLHQKDKARNIFTKIIAEYKTAGLKPDYNLVSSYSMLAYLEEDKSKAIKLCKDCIEMADSVNLNDENVKISRENCFNLLKKYGVK